MSNNMVVKFYVLVLFILIWNTFTISVVFGKECTKNDEKRSFEGRLKKDLLCNYDKDERPVKNHNKGIVVDVGMQLKQLQFNEGYSSGSSISVHSWMIMKWKDEYLTWNPAEYGNLKSIQISSGNIWLPGLTMHNGNSPTSADGRFESICLLNNTGDILCVPHLAHSAICIANFKSWPFDKHNCTMQMGSWMNYGEEVDYEPSESKGIWLDEYTPNPNWKLLSAKAARYAFVYLNKTYPQLRYEFCLARHNDDHIALIIWPAIVMILISLAALLIDTKNVDRLTLLCVNLLSHFLWIQLISFFIPKNGSNVPLIALFFRDSMMTNAFIIIFTVFLRRLSSLKAEMPRWLLRVAFVMDSIPGKIIMFNEFDPDSDNAGNANIIDGQVEEIETNKMISNSKRQWIRLTLFLDRLIFLVILVVYFALCVALLPF